MATVRPLVATASQQSAIIFRWLLVETPSPLDNLPIEQADCGIGGPSRCLLYERADVFEQIARVRGGRKFPDLWRKPLLKSLAV